MENIERTIDKGVLGAVQRIIQRYLMILEYGISRFIDNLQNIVTEYMKYSAYSVGISDLIADEETNKQITKYYAKKKEVQNLIDQTIWSF